MGFFDYVCTIGIKRPEKVILTEIGRQVYEGMPDVQSDSFSFKIVVLFCSSHWSLRACRGQKTDT